MVIPRYSHINSETLMLHLFATTDLERSCHVNINMIGLDGRPQIKNLRDVLLEWLVFRKETIRRQLRYSLNEILNRIHILSSLPLTCFNIDEVVTILRTENKPKIILMERFSISNCQYDYILDLKLRHLNALEKIKICDEMNALTKEESFRVGTYIG
ncbi:MAG: hypothetical protein HRT91_02970 [Piscirickettsiaceae bacterium]|nr:hypothetical protein [Piscirickettsiaceae bacterium]